MRIDLLLRSAFAAAFLLMVAAAPAAAQSGKAGQDPQRHLPGSFVNAFTPNADGVNDLFEPAPGLFVHYRMLVYDRWGQKVFETSSSHPWDGNREGHPMPAGVYVYKVEGTTAEGNEVQHAGTVMLLR